MGCANRFVAAVLRSPAHRLLSGSTDLVRYRGRRSRREIVTPTQYARFGQQDLVILVGRPEQKSWWRNFRTDGSLDVLLDGRWVPMTGRALVGADDPAAVVPFLGAYLERFPKAGSPLGEGNLLDRAGRAVIVWCRPR